MAAGARAWATEIGTRSRSRSRCATSGCPRSRPSGASGDAARTVGRRAVAGPAQRLSCADRPGGRRGHPPGRAGRRARRLGEHPRRSRPEAADRRRSPQTPVRRADPYRRTGRYGRGPGDQRRYERYGDRRGGIGGHLRFLLFLVVIAVLVLVVMATVARPLLRAVVVPLGVGQPVRAPARLRVGPRPRGPRRRPDRPRLERRHHGGVRRPAGRHAGQPCAAARGRRDHRQPAGLPVRGAAGRPAAEAQRRPVLARPEPHAGRGRRRPRQQPDREPGAPGHLPRGPAARADDGEAADDPGDGRRPAGVLRPGDEADGRPARRLPVAAGRDRPAQGRLAGGFLYPATYTITDRQREPDHRRRPGQDDARRVLRARRPRPAEGARRSAA